MIYRVVAFVPLKRTSRRIPGKNCTLLGGRPLYQYILDHLLQVREIDQIFVYASSSDFLSRLPRNVQFLKRPAALDDANVRGNAIYRSFCRQVSADIYLLAHATAPFLLSKTIRKGLRAVLSGKYDSAFSCRRQDTYAWFKSRPLNYRPEVLPQTQELEPVYMETNGFYVFRRELMVKAGKRIGRRPLMCEVGAVEGIDIDYSEDLQMARELLPLYRQLFRN
jgi:CMP-N-acetylneuraminic acid synthetase